MTLIDEIESAYLKKSLPEIRPGDTIRIFVKVTEGNRERLQAFEGIVLRKLGGGNRETITVRKISFGCGVERIFPLHSPVVDRIELITRGKVNRARLYYLRDLSGRAARVSGEETYREEIGNGKSFAEAEETDEPDGQPDNTSPTREAAEHAASSR